MIEFELDDFWFARDVRAFNREIQTSGANLPSWSHGQLIGHFCHDIKTVPPSLVRSSSVIDWQEIVRTLKQHHDFVDEPFFYFISGVFRAGAADSIPAREGRYDLSASSTYELRLVHYSPGETNDLRALGKACWLVAEADGKTVSFVTNRRLAIDSGYDEKVVRFRTLATLTKCDAVVGLSRICPNSSQANAEQAIFDFDILLQIVPRWGTMLWQGSLVGALLAVQGLIALHAKGEPSGSSSSGHWLDLLVILLGLLTGIVASFSLRKP
jgi:hypothetical protein